MSHFILPHTDARSSINRDNIARTCTQCQGQIERVHRQVIEGQLREKEPHKIPACVDCHSPHRIRRVIYTAGAANEDCFRCHANPELRGLANGDSTSLYVNRAAYEQGMHGGTACAQCHTDVTPSARTRACVTSRADAVDCSACHAQPAADHQASLHGRLAAEGDPDAPVCLDCHDRHETRGRTDPASPTFVRNVPVLCARCASPPAHVRAEGAYPGYIVNITPDDSDGDGIPNAEDSCPNSNLVPTVVIKGCDAGVTNVLFPDGCTMGDLLGECYANSTNNGQFVSCGEHYINDWYNIGLITNAERRDIKTCMMNAYLPTDQAFIAGTVFNDANGNGKQDDNESGIAGVTVTLDGSATYVTNQMGAYVFQINQGGAHTVVETDLAGYISTTPNKVTINVIMGQYACKTIPVNAIAPAYIDTDMVAAVPANVLEKIVAKIPVGRLGKADEIARGVLFLVADDAGFVTGSTLSINGGQHMY